MENLNDFKLNSSDTLQGLPVRCKIEIDGTGVSLLPYLMDRHAGKVSIGEGTQNIGVHNYAILAARDRGDVHLALWLPDINAMAEILIETHARLINFSFTGLDTKSQTFDK